jgi:mRNA interferase RelE/StbE
MLWKILFTVPAQSHLQSIKASRIRAQIRRRIDALAGDPEKQGKPLGDELFDLRSVRAVKERYRIIYRVKKENATVCKKTGEYHQMVAKDIYFASLDTGEEMF